MIVARALKGLSKVNLRIVKSLDHLVLWLRHLKEKSLFKRTRLQNICKDLHVSLSDYYERIEQGEGERRNSEKLMGVGPNWNLQTDNFKPKVPRFFRNAKTCLYILLLFLLSWHFSSLLLHILFEVRMICVRALNKPENELNYSKWFFCIALLVKLWFHYISKSDQFWTNINLNLKKTSLKW